MKIKIKTLNDGLINTVEIDKSDTVDLLRAKIANLLNSPVENFRMLFKGTLLYNG
jgi:hypothetical protein